MKTTADFLDALRVKLNLPSDGRLADFLGMHRQHISRYRTLGGTFDDEMSMRVADLLEIDPVYVVACMHHQRTKLADVKKVWERIATLTAGLAVLVILSVTVPTAGHESALLAAFTGSYPVYYVKSIFEYWPLFLALFVVILFARPRDNTSKN